MNRRFLIEVVKSWSKKQQDELRSLRYEARDKASKELYAKNLTKDIDKFTNDLNKYTDRVSAEYVTKGLKGRKHKTVDDVRKLEKELVFELQLAVTHMQQVKIVDRLKKAGVTV